VIVACCLLTPPWPPLQGVGGTVAEAALRPDCVDAQRRVEQMIKAIKAIGCSDVMELI
jgi:hypothetical protein